MRRKVIKQGHNTLTITLPSQWVSDNKIQAGDDIDISESNMNLIIHAQPVQSYRQITIDIKDLDIPTIWKYYMAAYREGYDEIKFTFDPSEKYPTPYRNYTTYARKLKSGKQDLNHTALELIHSMTGRFVGFEVMESSKAYCLIKDMAELNTKEFAASMRRVFLLIKQMGVQLIEAIEANDGSTLTHALDADITVDKFTDFCLRVLNKGTKDIAKPSLLFSSLCLLELIGDEYKHICYHIIEDMPAKSLENLHTLAKMILEQFDKMHDVYYAFDRKKVVALSRGDLDVHFYLPNLQKGNKVRLSTIELEIFNHFRRIGHYINALLELRVEIELSTEKSYA